MNVQQVEATVIRTPVVSICSQDSTVHAHTPTQEMAHTVAEVRPILTYGGFPDLCQAMSETCKLIITTSNF